MPRMKLWLLIVAALLGFAALLYFAASSAQSHQITYDTYVSIMLTSLGVILGALAISVGVAAIWGYQQIKTEAAKAADLAVTERVNKLLDSQNLQGMISVAVQREGDKVYSDLNATRPEPSEVNNEPIAET